MASDRPRTPLNPKSPLTRQGQIALQEYLWELNQRVKRGLPPSEGHLPLDDIISIYVGLKYRRYGLQGGRRQTEKNLERDRRMLKEYFRRLPATHKKPTALMADIGKREELSRSRSIEIISNLLKKSSGKPANRTRG
jgi:hypothetical protein